MRPVVLIAGAMIGRAFLFGWVALTSYVDDVMFFSQSRGKDGFCMRSHAPAVCCLYLADEENFG